MSHKIYVVGIGPGAFEQMTVKAADILRQSDVIIGYTVYIDLVRDHLPGKQFLSTPMTKEADRCRMAFLEARKVDDLQRGCGNLRDGWSDV